MKPFARISLIAAIAAIGGFGAGVLLHSAATPIPVSTNAIAAYRQKVQPPTPLVGNPPIPSAPATAQQPSTPPRKPRPLSVPNELAEVFPSLTEKPSDWRRYNPEAITIQPFPGVPINFIRTSFKEDSSLTGGNYTTWVGRSEKMPGSALITVANGADYDALLLVPGNGEINYHISASGDQVQMSAINSEEVGCGIGNVMPRANSTPTTAAVFASNYKNVAQNISMPTSSIVVHDGVATMDLLFLYDSTMLDLVKTKTTSDPVSYLDAQLKLVTETMNTVLAQSNITTFKWRYVGVLEAPAYARTGKLGDDLAAISTTGVIGSFVSKARYDYGADDICLLVGTSLDFGGIANMNPQAPETKDLASCVVAGGGGWGPTMNLVSALVAAHELGHTLGCNHDRDTANIFNDGKYCYAWSKKATAPGYGGLPITNTVGTVMSYASLRIPYFSNPNITVDIYQELALPQANPTPIGSGLNPDYGAYAIGASLTDANPLYNAKVMADDGVSMSGLLDPIMTPTISSQPSAATVNSGGNVALSVSAIGGGLYYQWYKDGSAISGATAATFSKSGVTAADGGNYSVTVTNRAGSVISSAASVSVLTASPPPSGGGNGGGGGGGGAPSDLFLGALAVLCFVRWMAARK